MRPASARRGYEIELESERVVGECHAEAPKRRALPGSTAFTPSAAGLLLASEVVKDLISWDGGQRKGMAK